MSKLEPYNMSDGELLSFLKEQLEKDTKLSDTEIKKLKELDTEDYAIQGAIGLLVSSKARILLGKKQPFEIVIKELCEKVEVSLADIEQMANWYLDDDYSNEPEFVLRYVMLEYPKGQQ